MKTSWLNKLAMATIISTASWGFAQDKVEGKKGESAHHQTESTTMQLDGGKLIIVDKDGKKSEIDVGNAKSIIVEKERKSKIVDGQQVENKGMAKAIIMGPDGEVREIELAMPGDGFKFEVNPDLFGGEGQHGHAIQGHLLTGGKYFIGIQCQPISDALRVHLNIEGNKGLLVEAITADSPAEKAGLKANDILVVAGDKELTSIEDVVKVVNDAGEASQVVEFGIIRGGKETSVQVKPMERKEGFALGSLDLNAALNVTGDDNGDDNGDDIGAARLRFMPGVIRSQDHEDFQKAIEKFKAEMSKLGNAAAFGHAVQTDLDRAREELKKAREEMDKARDEMLRAVEELKKRKSSEGDDKSPNPAT